MQKGGLQRARPEPHAAKAVPEEGKKIEGDVGQAVPHRSSALQVGRRSGGTRRHQGHF